MRLRNNQIINQFKKGGNCKYQIMLETANIKYQIILTKPYNYNMSATQKINF